MNERERIAKTMEELIESKKAQIEEINSKLEELNAEASGCLKEMDAAASDLDEAAYSCSEAKLERVNSKISMYKARQDQISKSDYISEEESEAAIDCLLDYEKTIADEFEKAITPHLAALAKLHGEYIDEVSLTENTLREWTRQIRQTYYNRNGSTRTVDGKRTNRFDTPQALRLVPYIGCKASGALGTLLDAVKRSME